MAKAMAPIKLASITHLSRTGNARARDMVRCTQRSSVRGCVKLSDLGSGQPACVTRGRIGNPRGAKRLIQYVGSSCCGLASFAPDIGAPRGEIPTGALN